MRDFILKTTDFKVDFFNLEYPHVSTAQYMMNCAELVRRVATSEIVFIDDASDCISALPLRKETTVINLWHACGAFKKFGMSTADAKFGGSRTDKLEHPFYENLSLVSVSSAEIVPNYIEAMALEENPTIVQPLGVSRTDVFFDSDYVTQKATFVRENLKALGGRKIILYAPTFRGHATAAKTPEALNLSEMERELGNDYILLIKNHPYIKYKSHELPPFAYDISDKFVIEDLMMAADICITDYSSLAYEYALLDRPLIYFCYDIDEYEDWRGFYYNYDEITPGPKCKTTAEVIAAIKTSDSQEFKDKRREFRGRFMNACNGGSTERIWKRVVELYNDRI